MASAGRTKIGSAVGVTLFVVAAVLAPMGGASGASASLPTSSRAAAALAVAEHWLDAQRGSHPARARRYEAPRYKSFVPRSSLPRKAPFTRCAVQGTTQRAMRCDDFFGTYEVIGAEMTRYDGHWKVLHVYLSSTD